MIPRRMAWGCRSVITTTPMGVSSLLGEEVNHMARVSYYYSTNPTDPDVYHWWDNCPTGQQIPAHNRAYGRPATHRECQHCVKLGR